ncbi:hypothetical protein HU200_057451 [Digitaria exilis]|uniref:Uncharacterized protein n=1 Tax=Digitaria exilis TaxID=1010633 RepID=A0A835AHK1_9POAL|nr:hypothetical protein HU200_057451 [Digitaria exilis]
MFGPARLPAHQPAQPWSASSWPRPAKVAAAPTCCCCNSQEKKKPAAAPMKTEMRAPPPPTHITSRESAVATVFRSSRCDLLVASARWARATPTPRHATRRRLCFPANPVTDRWTRGHAGTCGYHLSYMRGNSSGPGIYPPVKVATATRAVSLTCGPRTSVTSALGSGSLFSRCEHDSSQAQAPSPLRGKRQANGRFDFLQKHLSLSHRQFSAVAPRRRPPRAAAADASPSSSPRKPGEDAPPPAGGTPPAAAVAAGVAPSEQARKALCVRSPFDGDEAVGRDPWLPSRVARWAVVGDVRKKHKKGQSQLPQPQQQQPEPAPPVEQNPRVPPGCKGFWEQLEPYFRDFTDDDFEELWQGVGGEFGSISCSRGR